MANNVYSTIRFVSGNKEAEEAYLNVFQWIEDVGEHGLEFAHILSEDEFADTEFMELNIGPKWAYITSFMGTEVQITSGWISPKNFFRILAEDLSGFDPDVQLTMTYVDEFYNFAGVYWWKDDDINQQEESGGWFKIQHDKIDGEPRDLPDYITDEIERWGVEWDY